MNRRKRSYDHRIKWQIARTRNPHLFPDLKIPLSTAKNWINRGVGEVVTHEIYDFSREELEQNYLNLQIKLKSLESRLGLLISVFKIFGFTLQYQRIKGEQKTVLINEIKKAHLAASLENCLETIGLTKQRYYGWLKRQKICGLEDHSSCPKLSPTKITGPEISLIKKYVKKPEFSHFSLTSLWLYLRKRGDLVISNSSWFRIIRDLKLQRAHRKKYYSKPRVGIRADQPNRIWHIDMSVLRFNGIKAYVQAVRDNFSRFVLAYRVSEDYGSGHTASLIRSAIERAKEFGYFNTPDVMSDKGSENINSAVRGLVTSNSIRQIIAQLDIQFSNSMIESLFHQLKNRYLYYKDIHQFEKLKEHIDFYMREHNEVIPFASLNGATPREVYESGTVVLENRVFDKELVVRAMAKRKDYNRSLVCSAC